MNSMRLDLEVIEEGQVREISGIAFTSVLFISIRIDEVNILALEEFTDSVVYFEELKRTVDGSGRYLIFTSVNGVADDAGWDYVQVFHDVDEIQWRFERDDETRFYAFSRASYVAEILRINGELRGMKSTMVLEPKFVIFPELT